MNVSLDVVWNGQRGSTPPPAEDAPKPFLVFDPPARPRRGRQTVAEVAAANRAGGKVRRNHVRIWAQLATPVTTRQIVNRLVLPMGPVATLLCKAVRAGVVVMVGQDPVTGQRQYQRAPEKAQAFTFPQVARFHR